jgi:site-specific recombinase XerD
MRSAGRSAISTNSYLRVLKVFVRWLNILGEDGTPLRVPTISAPRLVPRTFSRDELQCLLHVRPATMTEARIFVLMQMYLDTGARAEELLFSLPLRAELHRWLDLTPDAPPTAYLFPTPRGHYSYRNPLRDFVTLANSKGITGKRVSFHTLRHSFATLYIANGGDPMRLQRLLGHSTLTMTQKYVSLQTRDLSNVHEQFSPLGAALRGRRR